MAFSKKSGYYYTASTNKHARKHFKKTEEAAKEPYISFDDHSAGLKNVLHFDVDGGNAALAWHDADIPFKPAFFVGKERTDRKSGVRYLERAHIVVKLRIPVKATNMKAMRLFNAVHDEISGRLKSEGCKVDGRNKLTVKNPQAKIWTVIYGDDREWTLYELAALLGLDIEAYKEQPKVLEYDFRAARAARAGAELSDYAQYGRNCEVFEVVRLKAYALKKDASSEEELRKLVAAEVAAYNRSFAVPLPLCEERSISKSISKWTWYKYNGDGYVRNRGAAAHLMSPSFSKKQKQAVGGIYAASIRAEKSEGRVAQARAALAARGEKISISAIAREAKLCRATVRRVLQRIEVSAARKVGLLKSGVSILAMHNYPKSNVIHSVLSEIRHNKNNCGAVELSAAQVQREASVLEFRPSMNTNIETTQSENGEDNLLEVRDYTEGTDLWDNLLEDIDPDSVNFDRFYGFDNYEDPEKDWL